MKVRNGWIVAEFTLRVFLTANFGRLSGKAALWPLPAGAETQA
jgi:hypothetical protein